MSRRSCRGGPPGGRAKTWTGPRPTCAAPWKRRAATRGRRSSGSSTPCAARAGADLARLGLGGRGGVAGGLEGDAARGHLRDLPVGAALGGVVDEADLAGALQLGEQRPDG